MNVCIYTKLKENHDKRSKMTRMNAYTLSFKYDRLWNFVPATWKEKVMAIIVRSRWEDSKKNVNIFSILHAIVTQLMPINWRWKRAYYTRNSALCSIGKYSKLKNYPLSKAYRRVVCVPAFVSAFCDFNSTWLLHEFATTPTSIWSL